jgi:hypothetical protein
VTIDVFEDLERSPRGEIWYGVRVNGRDLQALWADPDAARRRGEAYARESRSRGGAKMETETETLPATEPEETPAEPETEETEEATEAEPEENGDDAED